MSEIWDIWHLLTWHTADTVELSEVQYNWSSFTVLCVSILCYLILLLHYNSERNIVSFTLLHLSDSFYWYDIRRHNTLLKQDKTSVWNFMSCNLCVKKTVCSCVFWSCFKCLFTWINAQFLKSSNNSIFYKTKQNLASKEGFIWWPFGGAFSGIVKHCSVWQNISVCFCLTQIYWNSCWLSSYSNCIWFALFPLCE